MADEEKVCPEPPQCEECPPAGAPAWMATFSDLVTLLLTFFVLLYAMSKQDTSKFESVAGSIRKAFAGNAMKVGETIQLGKSPDDSPTMIENQEPIEPFPIDLITTEGILDKHELNRESDEDLIEMKDVLAKYSLSDSVDIYQMNEGVKIRIKDKIIFEKGSSSAKDINVAVLQRMIKLLRDEDWTIFVEGYAAKGEKGAGNISPLALSSLRAQEVTMSLIKLGVREEKISTVSYSDSRAVAGEQNSKVEFVLRKRDLRTEGRRVSPY